MATGSWWEDNGYEAPQVQSNNDPLYPTPTPDATTGMGINERDPSYYAQHSLGYGGQPAYDPRSFTLAGYNLSTGQGAPSTTSGPMPVPNQPTGTVGSPGFIPPMQGGSGPMPVPQGNNFGQISAWFKSLGVSDPDYYARQALQADPSGVGTGEYWANRVRSDMAGSSGGGAGGGVMSGAFLQPYGGQFSAPYQVPQFSEPFTEQFQAPTGLNFMNDPGYKERLAAGQEAMQNSAAAKGTLLTGSFQRDLNEAAQNFASNEYANVFNRALQGYGADINRYNTNLAGYGASLAGNQQAYNQALGAFGTNYDIFRNNQTDPYNKLMGVGSLGLSGIGQANAAGAQYGNQVGNNASAYGNLATGYANNAGNIGMNLGNVNAANTANQFNAWTQPLGAAFNWYQQYQQNQPGRTGTTGTATGGTYNGYPYTNTDYPPYPNTPPFVSTNGRYS